MDTVVDRLAQVAVTGAELAAVASYYEGHGRVDLGLLAAREAVRRAPLCWSCQDVQAMLLFEAGDVEGALAANARALSLLPERDNEPRVGQHRRMFEAARRAPGPPPGGADPAALKEEATAIAGVLGGAESILHCCYELGRRTSPGLSGMVKIDLTLDERGVPAPVAIAESTLGAPAVEQCVVRTVSRLRFRPPAKPPFQVRYPIRFAPRADEPKAP